MNKFLITMFKGIHSIVALSINLRRHFEYLYVETNILFCDRVR